jgi:hypothetical protein
VNRSTLPLSSARRFRVSLRAALIGGLAVAACSFQDFDYLKDGKNGAATGGFGPWNGYAGYAGYDPWHDDPRAGGRPGNSAGASGIGAGGTSSGGTSTAATGGTSGGTESAGAAGL